ncbi:MAG: DNA cytosine methyltransferase [Opitutae bacterium]|nr:DNA cytosine methyltransferase [Opitutae bacterium]
MGGMQFIDLFCGVGGFRWALEALGHKCVFSSDLDPHAQETYALNFGEKPFGDITCIDPSDIPGHDVVCGGFPCQPFSISGKQLGFEDARGTLLYHILRIVERHQPKVLFLENVKNYRGHNDGRTLATTLQLLDRVGYHCHHSLLNASSYGVPQKRERLYFVCFRKDLGLSEFSFPEPTEEDVAVEDVLLPSGDPRLEKLFVRRPDTFISTDLPAGRDLRPLRVGTIGKGGQGERIYSTKGHAITLSAFGGGVGAKTGMYLVDGHPRRLHPEECRRVMSFPEGFKLHPNRNVNYKQFGNSVAVKVVRLIFEQVESLLRGKNRLAA